MHSPDKTSSDHRAGGTDTDVVPGRQPPPQNGAVPELDEGTARRAAQAHERSLQCNSSPRVGQSEPRAPEPEPLVGHTEAGGKPDSHCFVSASTWSTASGAVDCGVLRARTEASGVTACRRSEERRVGKEGSTACL